MAYSLSIFGLGSVHEKLGVNGHCFHLHVGRYLLDTFLTLLTLSPMPAPCKMRRQPQCRWEDAEPRELHRPMGIPAETMGPAPIAW